jgi:predicted dehydrogenase
MSAHRIGLIGCGGIASAWIRAVAEHDDCEFDWVFDLDADAAARRAEETSATVMTDLESGLASADIDMVVIGTPTSSHPGLVAQAAAAGKHVMCEKPMALGLDDCQAMIEACTTAGVQLAIGHSLRFWGAFLKSRRLIADGAIGTPVSGSIDRLGAAKARQENAAGATPDHWRNDPANTGGHALEGFIHELDFTRSVFGEVQAVSCEIGEERVVDGYISPQIIQGAVTFAHGAVVTTRTGSTVGVPTRGYWIAGSEGGLRFDGWGGPIELYRRGAEQVEIVECEEVYAYHLELKDLTDAIDGHKECPENDGINGRRNVGLGLALYRAYETGARVSFTDGLADLPDGYLNTKY